MKLKSVLLASALAAGALAVSTTPAHAFQTCPPGTVRCGTQINFYSDGSRTEVVGGEINGCGPQMVWGEVTRWQGLVGGVPC